MNTQDPCSHSVLLYAHTLSIILSCVEKLCDNLSTLLVCQEWNTATNRKFRAKRWAICILCSRIHEDRRHRKVFSFKDLRWEKRWDRVCPRCFSAWPATWALSF